MGGSALGWEQPLDEFVVDGSFGPFTHDLAVGASGKIMPRRRMCGLSAEL